MPRAHPVDGVNRGHGLVPWSFTFETNLSLHQIWDARRLCLKSKNRTWIGSVQGAAATWSVIGMQYSRRILESDVGPGRYRSLY